ncbi:MAG: succinyl-CoA--3-ketoacid-CoA transferase [Candidatus Tectomicrobia bacterium RIFCSPLOWO2_12_FULL_69_37]|nr:MAG: succinyl-CoA--3-ketoacid-CoA transferase [Candidatus Tectomicrobia bacterium RIFCSPLOWO2_02_FULL_70_19]OGL67345.1 MAG: succinyl-CoA--3-ketoacid-CoA transferase [Candidatus Tectomicrobia bacterium RIFCSPLOWO2_12_FULL_69_37]
MSKVFPSSKAAVADIPSGVTLLVGGFGICGMPHNLCKALAERAEVTGLRLVSNAGGVDGWGAGLLFEARKVKAMMASRVGPACKAYESQVMAGEVELEMVPQGTLAERIRAGGAGLGGFFTPAGAGTVVAEGKESRIIGGREHILEKPIRGDVAFVRAWKADPAGNLVYRLSAGNFNHVMAMAADLTIAEVEEVVPLGAIPPGQVHTPGIFVRRIVAGEDPGKPIEIRTTRPRQG